jgi:hypothetical protein
MADRQAIYEDFGEMMRAVVIPMHLVAPDHLRLDSPRTDGNWDVLCRFRWRTGVWKVHFDSRYEPLILAYYGWSFGLGEAVFVEVPMDAGVRLDIAPSIAVIRPTSHRYLYLYRDDSLS